MEILKKPVIRYIITFLLIVSFFFVLYRKDSKQDISQSDTAAAEETLQEKQASDEQTQQQNKKDDKTGSPYGIHIGTSNIIAFIVLGGSLVVLNIKRFLDEKQKESK